MADPLDAKPAAVSLDELIAICEEMSALVRAGVPLESGLALFADETPGGLGKLAQRLATRLETGQSLADAFTAENQPLPEVYRSVIEAGLRSGRLAESLEGVARFARRVADLRSIVGLAVVYPIVVLLIASGIYRFMGEQVFFGLERLNRPGLRGENPWQGIFGSQFALLAGYACLAAVLAIIVWWLLTQRESVWTRGRHNWRFAWLPFVGRAVRFGRMARFVELLAILVEQDVPLSAALRLAGRGSGDSRLANEGEALAVSLEAGGTGERLQAASFPPLLLWLVRARQPQAAFVQGVRQLADSYVARASDAVARARIFVPMMFTLIFAGGAVFWLAFSFLGPWSWLLRDLAVPQ